MGDLTPCQYLLEKMKVKGKVGPFQQRYSHRRTHVQALSAFDGKRGNQLQTFSFASVTSLTFDLRIKNGLQVS
jgi:hypothetical protein